MTPVYRYLDLCTAHLTEAEMEAVNRRLADFEEPTPRVIPHEYGAWVNVLINPELALINAELRERCPNLVVCIDRARELDCLWINFDQDASLHDGLRAFDW